jgi:hypothetical protein
LAEEERDQANARLALQYAVTRTLAEVRHLGEASSKLQKAIAEANGLTVAADLVEESLGVTREAGKA